MQQLAIDWPANEPRQAALRQQCELAAERAARRVLGRHGVADYGAAYRAYREHDADAPMTGLAGAWAEAQEAAEDAANRAYGSVLVRDWHGLWPMLRGW